MYIVDPGRLLHDMPRRAWTLWRAYFEIDPQDENRADLRAAQIAWAVLAAGGVTKMGGGTFRPDDFLPYLKAQMDPDELARIELEREEAELMAFLERASGHEAHRYREG